MVLYGTAISSANSSSVAITVEPCTDPPHERIGSISNARSPSANWQPESTPTSSRPRSTSCR